MPPRESRLDVTRGNPLVSNNSTRSDSGKIAATSLGWNLVEFQYVVMTVVVLSKMRGRRDLPTKSASALNITQQHSF